MKFFIPKSPNQNFSGTNKISFIPIRNFFQVPRLGRKINNEFLRVGDTEFMNDMS